MPRPIQHSSIRLRYRTKLLLWSVIRFGLSNLQVYPKINFFLRPSRVSTIKLTYAPAGKIDNYPLCCDDKLRSLFATFRRLCNSCCTQWVKNNPVVGLRMVLLFSRFFMEDPKYLCFNGEKICLIVNISR